ncbi:hypothetical protein Tco_0454488 [Tanacetum coccineum]
MYLLIYEMYWITLSIIVNQAITQQAALDEALVFTDDRVTIGSCNMRTDTTKTKGSYLSSRSGFKDSSLYQFQLDNKKFKIVVELFCEILCVYPRVSNTEFVAPPPHDAMVTFIKSLDVYLGRLRAWTDSDYQELKSYGACSIRRMLILLSCYGKTSRTKLTTGKQVSGDVKACLIPDLLRSLSIISLQNTSPFLRDKAYLAISTGIVVPKKARKGMKTTATPKKNLAADTQKVIKASRRAYKYQQQTGGLSEGASITLEVLDESKGKSKGPSEGAGITPKVPVEPKGKSVAQDDDRGSDEEEEIISIDDEETELEKDAAESEKAEEEKK